MQTNLRNMLKFTAAILLLALALWRGAGSASAASLPASPCVSGSGVTTCDLYAMPGTATLFGATSVNIWGYSATGAAGSASLPGPILIANQGDTVTVNLHNNLGETTSLVFEGQSMPPDTSGVAAGGTKSYTFSASRPGTFLYEAGILPGLQHQVAMGLAGALVVKPADGSAYGSPATAYNEETVLVLSEIDTTLNTVLPAAPIASPASFDMRNYAPKYFLINGKAYASPFTGDIPVTAGNKVLLRYVNAGLQSHAMSTLGVSQSVIATDGFALVHPHSMVSETIATGQTLDALVSIPAGAGAGTRFALYDANMLLRNSAASGFGGMLTFLTAGAGTPPAGDTTGPAVSAASLSPNPTNGTLNVSLAATVSDVSSGNHNVTQAEFYIDSTSASPTALSGSFGSPSVAVSGSIPTATLAGLASGNHTIFIRGRDDSPDTPGGNWGPFLPLSLNLDKAGPATSGLSLTPNPSTGAESVALGATGSDTASGNSNVTAAEYWVDGGAHTAMTASGSDAPTRSFSATIASGLGMGTHVVSVRSQDAFGNWGPAATINLVVGDTAAPATSAVSAAPNPNNGSYPLSTSIQAVRVTASFSDVATGNSNIATAEGFIDTLGATGTGFVFIANDGAFNSPAEAGYSDIPLVVVGALADGNHTIYVHAKDAAGNWGANATVTLLIDRTAPTFTGITLNPNSIFTGTANTLLTLNGAADPLVGGLASGVAGGEYWFGTTVLTPGTGTPFSGVTNVPIPTASLAAGTYTLSVRIRDAAGNWSTGTGSVRTATLTVVPDVIFSNSFTSTTAPWGWSSRSTTTTSRLNRSAAASLDASGQGLQAQGNNTNYVQENFTPAAATYDARFYFNPNGNASTGQDIFAAATSSGFGTQLFHVRYRVNAGQPQVQIQVGATANATWVNITNAVHRVEVVWQSGLTLQLYVDGVSVQTATVGAGSVSAVRLGSVTSGGSATLMYFDAFVSKRSVSPLIGP